MLILKEEEEAGFVVFINLVSHDVHMKNSV